MKGEKITEESIRGLRDGSLIHSRPLEEWVKERTIDLDNQLIPRDVSLDIKDFKDFITKRKALLKDRLMTIVQ